MRPRKLAMMMMSVMLVFGSLPITASAEDNGNGKKANTQTGEYSTKDETIYGNLNAGGTLQDMYVVNTFHVSKPGEIVDYGDYTNVRNLSNLKDIETDGNTIRLQAKEDEFYYQGDMKKKPLPWDINITYVLDGEEVAPDELAGKSGPLEIKISTSENDKADSVFFENYMLQISLTLDPATFEAIQAPNGTKANAGKDTQVTFTVLPEKRRHS